MLATGPCYSHLPSLRRPAIGGSCFMAACVLVVAGWANTAQVSANQQTVEPPLASKLDALNSKPATASTGRESVLTEVDQRVIEWFDSLGFPKFAELNFVRVASGWSGVGDEEPDEHFMLEFLLSDDGATFTVLTFDLTKAV